MIFILLIYIYSEIKIKDYKELIMIFHLTKNFIYNLG